jgi:hypothetical protein
VFFVSTGLDTICLSIAVSVVQIYVFDEYFVNGYLCSNGYWIHRPFVWCWVNACLVVQSAVTGFYRSITRLGLLMLFSVFSLFSLHYTIYPQGYEAWDRCWYTILVHILVHILAHMHSNRTLHSYILFTGTLY